MVATSQDFFLLSKEYTYNMIIQLVMWFLRLYSANQNKNKICRISWFFDSAQNLNFKEDDETFLILPSFVLFDLRRLTLEKVTENNGH